MIYLEIQCFQYMPLTLYSCNGGRGEGLEATFIFFLRIKELMNFGRKRKYFPECFTQSNFRILYVVKISARRWENNRDNM